MNVQHQMVTKPFTGLLAGLEPGPMLSWGVLEVVSLFPEQQAINRSRFVPPLRHLKLVQVPRYGTLVLRNTALVGTLIVPMHIGFFQEGAQNHATSRVLILEAGETLTTEDCFCIQQTQGGFLKEAQQRFITLPLGLRKTALAKRQTNDFTRLWQDIDAYTRLHGVRQGGHLDRFLRPNFARLLPYRHAFEAFEGQVGAAYFIAGQLVGIEVAPNAEYWQELMPILNIYCYGPAALLAEQRQRQSARQPIELGGLTDLDDLQSRLLDRRERERAVRVDQIDLLDSLSWGLALEQKQGDLQVLTVGKGEWQGQMVRARKSAEPLYLSLFSDLL